MQLSFPRYLTAKQSVDDRALNRQVWQTLVENMPIRDRAYPVRVLEIGAGSGTMFTRMVEWGLLSYAAYTALDTMPENILAARQAIPEWAKGRGLMVESGSIDKILFWDDSHLLSLELVIGDLLDFLPTNQGKRDWDLLVAHAFLDLMDIPSLLPRLFALLRSGGLFYFTINFDGETLFEPTIDRHLDEQIEDLYHRNMDERHVNGKPSGDSRAGRHLFSNLKNSGARILASGASDWVVFPGPSGYQEDEAYFLHFIIETIHQALEGHAELDPKRFSAWVKERHTQIERHELIYIAHQLDFVGQV